MLQISRSGHRLRLVERWYHGNLFQELMKCDLSSIIYGKEKLEWPERIEMAIDIARGMNYLHSCKPIMIHRFDSSSFPFKPIHRDLKSNNLLLDESRRIKISGFPSFARMWPLSDFGTAITKEKMGTEMAGTGKPVFFWIQFHKPLGWALRDSEEKSQTKRRTYFRKCCRTELLLIGQIWCCPLGALSEEGSLGYPHEYPGFNNYRCFIEIFRLSQESDMLASDCYCQMPQKAVPTPFWTWSKIAGAPNVPHSRHSWVNCEKYTLHKERTLWAPRTSKETKKITCRISSRIFSMSCCNIDHKYLASNMWLF
jgi:hypothetical protein